jgi:hypothetical protein
MSFHPLGMITPGKDRRAPIRVAVVFGGVEMEIHAIETGTVAVTRNWREGHGRGAGHGC